MERRGFARQRHIISITPYVREVVRPLTPARIHDIENPVDERFFAVRPADRRPRVLCVGWLNERKNSIGAVRAFARAARAGAPGRLAFAGAAKSPHYRRRLERCIREEGLADRVELLGHISRTRLLQELSRASLMLLPSRQENAAIAVAEAMAAGLPVIAANRCGMPYMIEPGRTGCLIDPEDRAGIAARLTELLTDARLRQRLGAAARRAAEARWHPRVVAEKTIQVYRAAIGQAAR